MKTWNILPLLALFLMTLFPSSYAADLPTKLDRPVIKVGDTWTYIRSIGANVRSFTYKVVNIQPGGGYQVEAQSNTSSGSWKEDYDPNGNVVTDFVSIFTPSREISGFLLRPGNYIQVLNSHEKTKKIHR